MGGVSISTENTRGRGKTEDRMQAALPLPTQQWLAFQRMGTLAQSDGCYSSSHPLSVRLLAYRHLGASLCQS